MRIGKCQCTIFKEQFSAFLRGEVDGETKAWMELHKIECEPCREWCKNLGSVSSKVAIDSLNSGQGTKNKNTEEAEKTTNEVDGIKETDTSGVEPVDKNVGKAFMIFGFGVIVFAAVLTVRFISL